MTRAGSRHGVARLGLIGLALAGPPSCQRDLRDSDGAGAPESLPESLRRGKPAPTPPDERPGAEAPMTMYGTIADVDRQRSTVTLRLPDGQTVTLRAEAGTLDTFAPGNYLSVRVHVVDDALWILADF